MKKSLIALAALAVVSAASAQSSVTVYGRVDLGLSRDSGGPATGSSVTRLDSGIGGGSRLGFRGVEDLGAGLKANFVAETGFCADSNSPAGFCTGGNNFMGRQATVGLSGSIGSIDLGRQYTPVFLVENAVDPFGIGYAGQITNLFDAEGGYQVANLNSANPRQNNTIKLTTADYSGFSGSVAYGLGEVAGNSTPGRNVGFNLQYANGPIYVGLGYADAKGPVAAIQDSRKSTIFGATYDFGVAKAHFAYAKTKNDVGPAAGATQSYADANNYMLGVSAPIGAGRVMASYIRHDDRGVNNADASQFGIGYTYALSKRTSLYTAYAKINNKNGAFYTVGNSGVGGIGNSEFNLGVAHTF
jgi:predicted porin